MAWRHGPASDHRTCQLLGTSPWFEEIGMECNSRGMDCQAVGIPVLYLAARYGALEALQYLTAHVKALSVGSRMRVILPPPTTGKAIAARSSKSSARPPAGAMGWINLAHVACAYGELEILEWALNHSSTASAGLPAGKVEDGSLDLQLKDPRGRLAIHYCAREADDPRLLGALLSGAMDSARRIGQLMGKDGEGKTAEDLLASRLQAEQRHGQKRQGQQGRGARGKRGDGGRRWVFESLMVVQGATNELLQGESGTEQRKSEL